MSGPNSARRRGVHVARRSRDRAIELGVGTARIGADYFSAMVARGVEGREPLGVKWEALMVRAFDRMAAERSIAEEPVAAPSLRIRAVGPNQERYLLAETLTDPVYMIPLAYRLVGALDVDRLRRSLNRICNRHEVLRTDFRTLPLHRFEAAVHADTTATLTIVEASGEPDIDAVVREHFFRKADLCAASLRKFLLIRQGARDHVLVIGQHHSVTDGISLQVFTRELFDDYAGRTLEPPPPSYFDYFADDWRQSVAMLEAQTFWRERLAALPETAPIPYDRSENGVGPRDASIYRRFADDTSARLRDMAHTTGVTPFYLLYAATMLLLSRQTGAKAVATAFQSHGRRLVGASHDSIGPFSNALPLICDIAPELSFEDLARNLSIQVSEALRHEAMPFHLIIRETGVHPAFGINAYPPRRLPEVDGLQISSVETPRQSDTDLNFRFFTKDEEAISLGIFYAANRISRKRAELLGQQVEALVGLAALNPQSSLASLPTPDRVRDEPDPPVGAHEAICANFLRHAVATPDAVAISHEGTEFTYGELEEQSARLATHLLEQGGAPGDIIGIVASRGPGLVAAIIAVLRAGARFVVFDPEYPDARLEQLISLSDAAYLIVEPILLSRTRKLRTDKAPVLISTDARTSPDRARLDQARPTDIAYYLFTSGTTGVPKCVACSHLPLVNFVCWHSQRFDLGETDRFTMLSGLSHDPLLRDIFTPLSLGAALLIPQQTRLRDPGALAEWFVANAPTIVHMTPPLGQVLIASFRGRPPCSSLRYIFWGGDTLRPALIEGMQVAAPNAVSVNFYGSTETPQAAAYFQFDGDHGWNTIPAGKGIAGFDLAVEDEQGQRVAPGEVGEITVRSTLLSEGYCEHGVLKPHGPAGRRDTYRTGDRGFELPSGDVVILGRRDDQIKIRGYRVDLAEVATALMKIDDVAAAEVLPVIENEEQRILAFVQTASGARPASNNLRAAMGHLVPDYMIPRHIHVVDRMPLLPNGKIDRAALRRIPHANVQTPGSKSPGGLSADLLKIMNREESEADCSFVELGGDSISYINVSLAIEEKLGFLPENWEYIPLREIDRLSARDEKKSLSRSKLFNFQPVQLPILIRAISIALIVLSHAGALVANGSHILFVVSGISYARFRLHRVISNHEISHTLQFILKYGVPAGLWQLARSIQNRDIWLPDLFLMGTLWQRSPVGHFTLWFLDILTACILLLTALALAFGYAQKRIALLRSRDDTNLPFLLAVMLLAAILYVVQAHYGWWDGELGKTSVGPFRWFWLFVLGACIQAASTTLQKTVVCVIFITMLYVSNISEQTYAFGSLWSDFFIFSVFLLLIMKTVYIPGNARTFITVIASNSLYIYIVNYSVITHLLPALGVMPSPLIGLAASLAVGIGLGIMWGKLMTIIVGLWRRIRPSRTPMTS